MASRARGAAHRSPYGVRVAIVALVAAGLACNAVVGIGDLPGLVDASVDATVEAAADGRVDAPVPVDGGGEDGPGRADAAPSPDGAAIEAGDGAEPDVGPDGSPDAGCPSGVQVSGVVQGLPVGVSVTLQLQDNLNETLTVTLAASGPFAFCPKPGALYTVRVQTPPTGGICALTGATGAAVAGGTSTVEVTCDQAVALAAGLNFFCAQLASGGVMCWGDNTDGQLVAAQPLLSPTPLLVAGVTGVTAITAGLYHACVLASAGQDAGASRVYCWGLDSSGQLGSGPTSKSVLPVVQVSGLTDAVAIAAGGNHTCALLASGQVMCWGDNTDGDLGAGSGPSYVPIAVQAPGGADGGGGVLTGATAIGVGQTHSCAVVGGSDGGTSEVVCWGSNNDGQLGSPLPSQSSVPLAVAGLIDVRQLALSNEYSCALQSDGAAFCWGTNGDGHLGNGPGASSIPVKVPAPPLQALATGQNFACGVLSGGSGVTCWGANQDAQVDPSINLGPGGPIAVPGLPSSGVDAVACGGATSCAVIAGAVECWGANSFGQAGTTQGFQFDTPQALTNLSGVVDLAAGEFFTCARLGDGGVDCWGSSENAQIGNGTAAGVGVFVPRPSPVSPLGYATGLGLGRSHACAVVDGSAECWGFNGEGQVGNGTTQDQSTPAVVHGASGVVAVSGGFDHECALVDGGAVMCWGIDENDELGNMLDASSGPNATAPVPVMGLGGPAVGIAAGGTHTCAELAGGAMQCWGSNGYGELGLGTMQQSQPATVLLDAGILQIAASSVNSCALLEGGVLDCWGGNESEELASPQPGMYQPSPQAVDAGLVPAGVAAGASFMCAWSSAGAATCWGNGTFGQLGTGGELAAALPAPVALPGPVTKIAAGWQHACALVQPGDVYCWGLASQGQLGTSVALGRVVPGPVP